MSVLHQIFVRFWNNGDDPHTFWNCNPKLRIAPVLSMRFLLFTTIGTKVVVVGFKVESCSHVQIEGLYL